MDQSTRRLARHTNHKAFCSDHLEKEARTARKTRAKVHTALKAEDLF
jgi:hypothetical protein